jgi:tetratricopeptide (TPR) repeat protein
MEMSKASRRRSRRHRNTDAHAAAPGLTPQQLFDRGDFKAAEERLMQIIDAQPTDKNGRLLAWCLCELNESEKAAATFLGLTDKTVHDYILAGRCYLSLERWDNASDCFGASLQLRETASGYYWLAITEPLQGRYFTAGHTLGELREQDLPAGTCGP